MLEKRQKNIFAFLNNKYIKQFQDLLDNLFHYP